MKYFFFLIILFLFQLQIKAQKSLVIKKAIHEIVLDGEINESDWVIADRAKDFNQNYPFDTLKSFTKTEVMVTFDDENLYIAAICYDDFPDKKYVVQSLKRDFNNGASDNFSIFIDPFNDKVNGFTFGITPLGVQREGLLENGGLGGITTTWDNKWFSKVKHYKDKWIAEMKIPFKSIRYNSNLSNWGINFSRNDLKRNERSTWVRVPRQYQVSSLAFTGSLNWSDKVNKAGTNISIIPYVIGSNAIDFEEKTDKTIANTGFDAKIAVTSSLNLDVTVNPDFSQVDVDRQVTNLSRFSLFFPEQRQFFIENSDLFSGFGFRQIRPFFSRRIGLNNGNAVPIIGGARLSGKLNENWRIGLMNIQTEGVTKTVDNDPIKSQNHSVAAIQRTIGKRSSLDGIFVNRQSFNANNIDYDDYNRVAGIQYNYRAASNKYQGKTFYNKSFTPNLKGDDFTQATWFMINTEKLNIHLNYEYVGRNHRAENGFVPRISQYNSVTDEIVYSSYWRLEETFRYWIYPKSDLIQRYGFGLWYSDYFNKDFISNEQEIGSNFRIHFTNRSEFNLTARNNRIVLPFPTDITFSGNTPLDSGLYSYRNAAISYSSSQFKTFSYNIQTDYGQYYIGKKLTSGLNLNYRIQPWGIFSLAIDQNKIWMPENFNDVSLWLVGPKLEFSFTKKAFFTTFIQYNTQIENVNINARFQYRFKPMSDLFIVYTDNYYSPNISIKNRGLVIKLVYWINA